MSAEHFLPVADQKNNIIRLSAAQALAGANSVVFYATGAIVGNAIAPDSSLATLPITMFVLGMAACILPLGPLARKEGRKAAFMVGTTAGVITGLTAALAVIVGSFLLFCIAAFLGGAYAAVALSFRFAATDGVTPERRARALSLVMGGGVIAGVVGPMLVSGTMHLWPPHTFAVTFIAQALVAVENFNPMYHFVSCFRQMITGMSLPSDIGGAAELGLCAMFAIVTFVVGLFTFKKLEKKFILYI